MSSFQRVRLGFFGFLLFASASTPACQKTNTIAPATGLTGTWQLTNRQCYCMPAPTPNEAVTFTNTGFAFYKNGQLAHSGAYSIVSSTALCGHPNPVATLVFTPSDGSPSFEGAYTLSSDQLTLDYGSPCDAPLDTYQRLP